MVGQLDGDRLGGHDVRTTFDRLGEALVEGGGLAGEEVLEDGLAQQRVAKAVGGAVDDEQLGVDRLAQPGGELGSGELRRAGDQLVFGLVAGDREQAYGRLRRCRQRFEADDQDVAQTGRQVATVGTGELLDEERDPVTAPVDLVDERGIGALGAQRREHHGDLAAVESRHGQLDHPGEPLQLGEERSQRMPAMQFVAAVGRDDEHRGVR